MSQPAFHFVVFGATSFVGQILTRYLLQNYGVGQDIHWAIAGRSPAKLNELKASLGQAASELPVMIADAANDEQLQAMCAQTRAVVSTVGPYALYGEPLVRACANSGTDYCDLTGEPQWIRRMLDKYENAAQTSGARIVHSCGFDSVPSDMGVYFLQQQATKRFGQPLTNVHMRVKAAKGGMSGGTIASIIELTKEVIAEPSLRKLLANPYALCPADHPYKTRQYNQKGVDKDTDLNSWTVPFIMAAINTRIVHRSNALRQHAYGNHFLYEESMLSGRGMRGWLTGAALVGAMGAFMLGAALKPSRTLLEKFILPKPGEGPSPAAQEAGYYDIRFIGRTDDNQTLVTRVTGDKDPGYGSTAKILGEAVISLACDLHDQDGNKNHRSGGFWTPASVFDDRYIDRLTGNAGLTFEVLNPTEA